jgi:glycosyltransferase involved in cell wall biosynthesis
MSTDLNALDIAVLVPCLNEALTIEKVVGDFHVALPGANIYVYDNCSTDDTSEIAARAGAVVREERWPGKGNVVRRMFADIEADVYIMVDGDGTYDAGAAPDMVRRLIQERLDMLVAVRDGPHRRYHGFGNLVFNGIYRRLIGREYSDIFSGYRAFSHRFVKSFPAISCGFEIETEMSVHASLLRMPVSEMNTPYGERPSGSVSKLKTIRDSVRILKTILYLFKEIRPAVFFTTIAAIFAVTAIGFGIPLLKTYLETGLVPRFPTAILATGLMILSALSVVCGLILDTVAQGRLEQKRILYLAINHLKRG